MGEEKKPEIKLKVAEARQDDVYKGIVRIDSESMRKIGVKPGDVVEIEGKRKTVAIVEPAYPEDVGLGVIRMDGITRKNAGASIGSYVTVRKADVKEAQKVVIAPAQKGVYIHIPPETVHRYLIGRPVMKGDLLVILPTYHRRRRYGDFLFDEFFSVVEEFFSFGHDLKFVVVNTVPKGPVIITEATEVEVLPQAVELKEEVPEVTYEDIGDMEEVVRKVRELVELPLRHPEIFERLGIEPPKGILLYGPPGTGKTLLAKAVANEAGAHFIAINGPEIVSKYVGESEKRLREIFEEARKNAPAIIFIDEIDAIAPRRDEAVGEVERRLVAQLLTLMDGLKERGKVIVIAATNRPNAIDPALRRPGRFDREIEVPVPNEEARYKILKVHTRRVPLGKKIVETLPDGRKVEKYVLLTEEEREQLLRKLAAMTHGYVGADLAALVKEAAMNAIRRVIPEIELYGDKPLPPEVLEKLVVTEEDFMEALKVVPPSAMREVLVEVPNVRWEDIGGLEEVKQMLKEMVEWPLKYRKVFEKLGIEPPKGILLYGPPGTGKTLLAKAIATECGMNFIAVKGPEIISKWLGESERAIREIFRKAKQVAPCVIFFDEIDAIAPRRGLYSSTTGTEERIVNQLLTEMDGITTRGDVIVIAATNRPDIIDPALLRPGRFDRIVYVPPPDESSRVDILRIHTRKVPLDVESVLDHIKNLKELVELVVTTNEKELKLFDIKKEEFYEEVSKLVDIAQVIETFMKENVKIDIKSVQDIFNKEILDKYGWVLEKIGIRKDRLNEKVLKYLFLKKIAKMTEYYSGADLAALVKEAALTTVRELYQELMSKGLSEHEAMKKIEEMELRVKFDHFLKALEKVRPSITKEMLEYYKAMEEYFKKGMILKKEEKEKKKEMFEYYG